MATVSLNCSNEPILECTYIGSGRYHRVVNLIAIDRIQDLSEVLSGWLKRALIFKAQAEAQHLEDNIVQQYGDAASLAMALHECFLNPDIGEHLYVACFDKTNNLQGCMICIPFQLGSQNILRIGFMVANPENFASTLSPRRVSGAGTALLSYAKDLCHRNNYTEIYVSSLPLAKAFYLRNGFNDSVTQGNCMNGSDLKWTLKTGQDC